MTDIIDFDKFKHLVDFEDATKNPLQVIESFKGHTVSITEIDFCKLTCHPFVEMLWWEQKWYWHWDNVLRTFKKYFYPATKDTMAYFNNTTWIIK